MWKNIISTRPRLHTTAYKMPVKFCQDDLGYSLHFQSPVLTVACRKLQIAGSRLHKITRNENLRFVFILHAIATDIVICSLEPLVVRSTFGLNACIIDKGSC